jgi:hypothetical protein
VRWNQELSSDSSGLGRKCCGRPPRSLEAVLVATNLDHDAIHPNAGVSTQVEPVNARFFAKPLTHLTVYGTATIGTARFPARFAWVSTWAMAPLIEVASVDRLYSMRSVLPFLGEPIGPFPALFEPGRVRAEPLGQQLGDKALCSGRLRE